MDNVRVGIRARPLNWVRPSWVLECCQLPPPLTPEQLQDKEVEDPSTFWRYDENSISLIKDGQPVNCYTFGWFPRSPLPSGGTDTDAPDNVFGENSQTIDVYNSLAKYIIDSALQGVNGTIFAYGQTSSGKTHTMKGDPESPGIIPLTIAEIFGFIRQVLPSTLPPPSSGLLSLHCHSLCRLLRGSFCCVCPTLKSTTKN